MKFIAMFWPVWLVLMVAGYGYMLYHHLLPDKTSWAVAALSDDHRKKTKMSFAAICGLAGMILLAIAIIIHIIDYAH